MTQAPASNGSVSAVLHVGLGIESGSSTTTAPLRSESMAYPRAPASAFFSKLHFYSRQEAQKFIATLAFLIFLLIVSSDYVHDSNGLGGLRGGERCVFDLL